MRIEGLKTWLASTRSRHVMLVIGVLLTLPSIRNRLALDDHFQAFVRMTEPPIDASIDLFTLAKPGQLNHAFIERGSAGWWTDPDCLLAFFRPLSALTHVVVDGWLWPQSPLMAHVQSIAWYLLLLALVSSLYSRHITPGWLAGLAFLLFALDDTHADAINWICNRHAVISAVLGLLAFKMHVSGRASNGKSIIWGPLCFAVALSAGEGSMAVFAYICSYALFVDQAPRRSRLLSIVPYAVIIPLWRVVYQRLGYGAFRSDWYLDPGREPLPFLARFPRAFVLLLQGALGGISTDYLWVFGPSESAAAAIGCFTAIVFFLLIYPLLRHDKMARFWCASFVGALVPATAGDLSDRTLLLASVAGAPLLAQLFGTLLEPQFWWGGRGWRRTLPIVSIWWLILRKLLFAPVLFSIRDGTTDRWEELDVRANDAIPSVSDLTERSVIVANPPLGDMESYIPLIRATRGQPVPRTLRLLATSGSSLMLTRTSERELLVRPANGFDVKGPLRRYPMKLGEKVELSDMTITITELRAEGNPAAAVFAFREPLESAKHLWLAYDDRGGHPFSPPHVGETTTLPEVDFWKLALRAWRGGQDTR